MNEAPPPPLTWRVWFLVPLCAVALLGIAVPVWEREAAPRLRSRTEKPRIPPAKRVPYHGELLRLLEREDLDPQERRAIAAFHDRFQRETREEGGILEEDWKRFVRRALERHR